MSGEGKKQFKRGCSNSPERQRGLKENSQGDETTAYPFWCWVEAVGAPPATSIEGRYVQLLEPEPAWMDFH